ncbi:MAG: sodium-dependent transporter, partial [Muribaculaceae bacterium]|nr:sodium-dependent transporter [Muribaculaceae bacterium]
FKIAGLTIFELLDTVATNIFLPIVSLLVCIFIGWVVDRKFLQNEITNNGSLKRRMFPVIRFIIRYVAPPLIFMIFLSFFIEF